MTGTSNHQHHQHCIDPYLLIELTVTDPSDTPEKAGVWLQRYKLRTGLGRNNTQRTQEQHQKMNTITSLIITTLTLNGELERPLDWLIKEGPRIQQLPSVHTQAPI